MHKLLLCGIDHKSSIYKRFPGLAHAEDPSTEGSDYVFDLRGTDTENGLSEFFLDGLFTGLAQITTGNMASQFLEAIMFVQGQMVTCPELNQGNTTFTGHSIGGPLSSVIT